MISVSIIVKDEEDNIERCLKSIYNWADEIIVVDSGSTDNTLKICKKYNCKIHKTHWLGFGKTKQLGVDLTENDWILSIDADEEISNQLKKEIKDIIASNQFNGAYIKRISYYLSRQIKYSGWQNDFPLRLFNKRFGNFDNATVHESVVLHKSKTLKICEPIYHYPYKTIHEHISKVNLYTTLSAEKLFIRSKKTSLFFAVLSGITKFIKMYLFKKGFLDGKEGLVLAILSSYSSFLKYVKLWSMWREK